MSDVKTTPEFRAFINDGYNRLGYIDEQPRLHPAVRFTYRPMLATERDILLGSAGRSSTGELAKQIDQAMAKRIISWDIEDNGRPVEITAANVSKIEPNLRDRLFWIISGSPVAGNRHISDIDPEWQKEKGSQIDDEVERAINGTLNSEAKDAGN